MNSLEKKSLQHIAKTLGRYDAYDVYSLLNNMLKEEGIEQNVRSDIMEKYQTEIHKETAKVNEAKEWVDTLLSDT